MSDDTHPSGDTGVSGWFQRLVQGRAGDVKTRDDIADFLETFHERGIAQAALHKLCAVIHSGAMTFGEIVEDGDVVSVA